MKPGKLVAVGTIYVDINAYNYPLTDKGLELETETVGSDYIVEPGGSAVNFSKLCGAMEIPTAFIGKVGNDRFGEILKEELPKHGVEPMLITSDQVATNISFNMSGTNGKSIMTTVGTANQALDADEVYEKALSLLPESPYLYLGGCFKLKNLMPAYVKLSQDAKNEGTIVVLDHGRLNSTVTEAEKDMIRALAKSVDIYLPSTDEFLELWGYASIEEGLLDFSKDFSGIVVLKNGSDGAVSVIDDQLVTCPPHDVDPIHTIGAGDSFNAGFIAAQYKGKGLLESIQFGCATAALKISSSELPTYAHVKEFLNTHQS